MMLLAARMSWRLILLLELPEVKVGEDDAASGKNELENDTVAGVTRG